VKVADREAVWGVETPAARAAIVDALAALLLEALNAEERQAAGDEDNAACAVAGST
jgi:hypothetical protein